MFKHCYQLFSFIFLEKTSSTTANILNIDITHWIHSSKESFLIILRERFILMSRIFQAFHTKCASSIFFLSSFIVMYMRKHFYLVKEVDEFIGSLKKGGIMNLLISKYIGGHSTFNNVQSFPSVMTTENLRGVFEVLLYGTIISCLVFMGEFFYFHKFVKQRHKPRFEPNINRKLRFINWWKFMQLHSLHLLISCTYKYINSGFMAFLIVIFSDNR